MATSVKRDPFARGEFRRECKGNADGHAECAWCGGKPRRLYRYTWIPDGVRYALGYGARKTKWFCNFSCYRAWTGE